MNKTETIKAAPVKKYKKVASLDKKKARAGWLFVLPFLLGFVIIYLPIVFDSIRYSFNKIIILPGGGYMLEFVGWENYQEALFVDPSFVRTLTSGIQQLLLDIPAIVIFALFMAVLLNQDMFGRAAFRAIFFVPVILSTGLIAAIDEGNIMLDYMEDTSSSIETGSNQNTVAEIISVTDIGWLFNSMAVGTELVEYVTSMINNIYNVINRSGVQMLIFLAGLQSISPAIYESCSIDGASAWETFWKITIPMVSPMILVNAIYTVIDSLTMSTNSVMSYISNVYNQAGGNVVSTAMSWVYFLLVLIIIAAVAGLLSAFVFYQRRD
ncbi:MAG: sugar ABC transporter permease [Clostridiales bacterium]|jgi:ABC-type sugar transport system permease subunit|nr:sugar ABC transporter permease [Clostridiales bacterium]